MKLYLLLEYYGPESSVIAVFRSWGRARAQKSIGEVAALRELEKHNQYCLEIDRSYMTMDSSNYDYFIREVEVTE